MSVSVFRIAYQEPVFVKSSGVLQLACLLFKTFGEELEAVPISIQSVSFCMEKESRYFRAGLD